MYFLQHNLLGEKLAPEAAKESHAGPIVILLRFVNSPGRKYVIVV